MSSTKKEYHIDGHAKIAVRFFLACMPNPDTRVKISAAKRAKGDSNEDSVD
jgi:hypothetical protein